MGPDNEISRILQAAREDNVDFFEALKLDSKILDWTTCCHAKSGDSPLHVAAKHGNIRTIRFLLGNCAVENVVSITNKNGKTALHEAAQAAEPVIVNFLIAQGAEVNCIKGADWTPLMLACTKSGVKPLETVNVLLANGADVKLCNKDGWTAVHIAARDSDVSVVRALLRADSSLAGKRSNNGRTPLHTAALHGRQDVAEMLIQHCPDTLDAADACGATPLLESVRNGTVELVQCLLSKGASLNHRDAMGCCALHVAAQAGRLQAMEFLVRGCNEAVNTAAGIARFTPLHCASRAGQVDAVKLLLSLGADPHLQDMNGRSVSDVAAVSHKQEIIKILGRNGKNSCISS